MDSESLNSNQHKRKEKLNNESYKKTTKYVEQNEKKNKETHLILEEYSSKQEN